MIVPPWEDGCCLVSVCDCRHPDGKLRRVLSMASCSCEWCAPVSIAAATSPTGHHGDPIASLSGCVPCFCVCSLLSGCLKEDDICSPQVIFGDHVNTHNMDNAWHTSAGHAPRRRPVCRKRLVHSFWYVGITCTGGGLYFLGVRWCVVG